MWNEQEAERRTFVPVSAYLKIVINGFGPSASVDLSSWRIPMMSISSHGSAHPSSLVFTFSMTEARDRGVHIGVLIVEANKSGQTIDSRVNFCPESFCHWRAQIWFLEEIWGV